jgi:hypothetical protein
MVVYIYAENILGDWGKRRFSVAGWSLLNVDKTAILEVRMVEPTIK